MQINFANEELEIFILKNNCGNNKFYKRLRSNATFRRNLDTVINTMRRVENTAMLYNFKSLEYEPLHYDLEGFHSIRIGYHENIG